MLTSTVKIPFSQRDSDLQMRDMSVTEIVHVEEHLRSQGKESAERQAALSRLYAQGLHCLPIPVNPYAGR